MLTYDANNNVTRRDLDSDGNGTVDSARIYSHRRPGFGFLFTVVETF